MESITSIIGTNAIHTDGFGNDEKPLKWLRLSILIDELARVLRLECLKLIQQNFQLSSMNSDYLTVVHLQE